MQKEFASCGDKAEISLQAGAAQNEVMGIEGAYHVECRDANGNLKWSENFPNLVNALGKQLMLDTLMKGSSYSVTGPYLGLIGTTSPTFAASDTMTSHSGWTEFTAYTVSSSAVRGTAVFATSTSTGTSPSNVTTSAAAAITYTIVTPGGNVTGCFLTLGSGASSTIGNTGGTLYSAGAFGTAKAVTAGDTVSVTYSTTATS
jgi:hypothetical protein